MQLLEADITEFQRLYQVKFGIELDHQSAHEKLAMLVRQVQLAYRPITAEQLKVIGESEAEDGRKNEDDNRVAPIPNQK